MIPLSLESVFKVVGIMDDASMVIDDRGKEKQMAGGM
jgi:hypothetical protein